MTKTFAKFLEKKTLNEAAPAPVAAPPAPAGGGIGTPGALPPGGGMGMPPPMPGGGMGMPPIPGGGMGMPGMGAPTAGGAPEKLKAYNVWDVLERVLSGSQKTTTTLNAAGK